MSTEVPKDAPGPSICARLRPALTVLRHQLRQRGHITIADLTEALGANAPALIVIVLSLPFLLPISLGPITTPVAIILAILAWQIQRSHRHSLIPQRYLRVRFPARAFHSIRWLVQKRIRRRGSMPSGMTIEAARNEQLAARSGLLILTGSLLLMVPIPLIPLSNTFPAIGMILAAAGGIKHRPSYLWLSSLFLLLGAAYLAFLAYGILFLGGETFERARQYLGIE